MMITTDACCRSISFVFVFRKRISGLAIHAMTAPMINGIKKMISFGTKMTTAAIIRIGTRIFKISCV